MKIFNLCAIQVVTLFYCTNLSSQYSTYYSNPKSDIYIGEKQTNTAYIENKTNINHKLDANISVNGKIIENKTITTIDYGALELANAQREKNRLEQEKYFDLKSKEIAANIANDPLNAHEYGNLVKFCMKDLKKENKEGAKQLNKSSGVKDFCMNYVSPNSRLFSNIGQGTIQNVSSEGVITEIQFLLPFFYREKIIYNLDSVWNNESFPIGESENGGYVHKKEKKPADVFGSKGIRSTLILEDKHEYNISDIYVSYDYSKGLYFNNIVRVTFRGDKSEVTFEQLEGRRYYFRHLIQKTIATAYVDKVKY